MVDFKFMAISHQALPIFLRGMCGAIFLFALVACEKAPPETRSDPALLQRAMELQRQVYDLEKEMLTLEQDANQAAPLREQLAGVITEMETAKLQKEKIETEFNSLQRDYKELIDQLGPINELLTSYENQLREALKGEALGDVELRDGRIIREAVVASVGEDWVALKHKDGQSNFEFNLLPDYLQRKFSFRPSMVTADSLIAQKPITPESSKPTFSPEDAAKAMHEAMALERERTRQKLQDGYRSEIAKVTQEIGNLRAGLKRLEQEKSAKRAEMNRPRKIKIAEADKKKAIGAFDFRISQAKREIAQREARLSALRSMLEPEDKG